MSAAGSVTKACYLTVDSWLTYPAKQSYIDYIVYGMTEHNLDI